MTGADALIRTAAAAGIDVCFANPGTTEMPLVAALDRAGSIRAVLGVFEGVCTGAADGYARMVDRPALTLLHLGPGFANGIANLHNARRARSPIVNVIGDHATWHLSADAPLTSDIESLARPVSRWLRTTRSARDVARDVAEAIAAAAKPPGGVASLIVPADCQWDETNAAMAPLPVAAPPAPAHDAVERVARVLRLGEPTALLLGGRGLREAGIRAASRIAAASGCRLFAETFPARMERGGSLSAIERLGYFPEQVLEALSERRHLVLAGAREPVAFFGYPGQPSRLVPDRCSVHVLADPEEDVLFALEALATALGGREEASPPAQAMLLRPSGELTSHTLGAAVAALQPEGAIIVDEALTSALPYSFASAGAAPHTLLTLTGGAIGQGAPCATGAAIACRDRPVIDLEADGSGLYTLQALWTQAREGLDVTTVICSNRSYRILQIELMRAGIVEPGPQALGLTELSRPDLDWVSLARGFGVPATRAETADELVHSLERSLSEPGPHLIEAVLAV